MIIIEEIGTTSYGAKMWRVQCGRCKMQAVRVGCRKIVGRSEFCGSCAAVGWHAGRKEAGLGPPGRLRNQEPGRRARGRRAGAGVGVGKKIVAT